MARLVTYVAAELATGGVGPIDDADGEMDEETRQKLIEQGYDFGDDDEEGEFLEDDDEEGEDFGDYDEEEDESEEPQPANKIQKK